MTEGAGLRDVRERFRSAADIAASSAESPMVSRVSSTAEGLHSRGDQGRSDLDSIDVAASRHLLAAHPRVTALVMEFGMATALVTTLEAILMLLRNFFFDLVESP
ncbi:hypothetical protein M513_14179 [Trichuris suis]|uniref:Uncharacterized protein n=1 Tax=Trichuris suis TaxID=68888 RepID=A0A085LIZ8_9BILA|nr:hypothetical protein M513_14179 [Trichuris suis]